MQKISSGLGDLPEDLWSLIVGLEQRLKELEDLVASIINNSGSSPVSPVGPVLSPSPPVVTGKVITNNSVATNASSHATDPTTTSTIRITRTLTSNVTVTKHMSMVTGGAIIETELTVNGTVFTPPAPWPESDVQTSTLEDVAVTTDFFRPGFTQPAPWPESTVETSSAESIESSTEALTPDPTLEPSTSELTDSSTEALNSEPTPSPPESDVMSSTSSDVTTTNVYLEPEFTPPAPWSDVDGHTESSTDAPTETVTQMLQSSAESESPQSTTEVLPPSYATISPTPSSYTFDPDSTSNVAVYYDSTSATNPDSLLTLCANPAVDIILLSSLISFTSPTSHNYPTLSLGPACDPPSPAQLAAGAPALQSCPALASQIATCQTKHGKKILLSLSAANTTFSSASQAEVLAQTLWHLFGPPSTNSTTQPLRPFGPSVILDGFHLAPESSDPSSDPSFYAPFASALRSLFASDPSREYFLSAAPRCAFPDDALPLDVLWQMDWVWVRGCGEGGEGALGAWRRVLEGGPRVFGVG